MQTIYQKAQRTCFTTIPNELIGNPNLSYKAKGILSFLISWPASSVAVDRIAASSKDGKYTILSGLKELESFGLVKVNNSGEWSLSESMEVFQ